MPRWSDGVLALAVVAAGVAAYIAAELFRVPPGFALLAGAILETAGFIATLVDVQMTAREVQAYAARHTSVVIRVRPLELRLSFPPGTVDTGVAPTVEERLASLEAAYASVRGEVEKAVRKAEEEARKAADDAAEEARADAKRDAEALGKVIEGISLGLGLRLRQLGIALFVVGVAVMTYANVHSLPPGAP